MRIILCDSYEEVSAQSAKIVESQVILKPDCVLGLATGSTPVGMYKKLIESFKDGVIDFSKVTTFNLDEYYPISPDNSQSYHYFMNENLFKDINVKKENIHILDGETKNPDEECERFEQLISEKGGIDLQILGIGQNGHIGFNEPEECLSAKTHLTKLTENTIRANSRFFDTEDDVPKEAVTMGMATILKSKTIVLMACGKEKSDAVAKLLSDDITTGNPSTLLKVHHNVIIICDKEAYSKVNN